MKLADFKLNNTELSIETKLKLKQHEQEMELLMTLFDIDSLEDKEEEVVEIEEVTQEDIEFELMMMDDFRDVVLDISENEAEWINNNVDLSHIIGPNDNTVMTLSRLLKMSATRVKSMVRSALGYKLGSDYQNSQRQYVRDLGDDFKDNLYEELERQLKKARLYDFYRVLLTYIERRVTLKPLGKNEDELTFFVSYVDLRIACQEAKLDKGIGDKQLLKKLNKLCGLGLLRNLEDEHIDDDILETAYSISQKQSKEINIKNLEFNRKNFYVLNDLSPQVQDEAVARIRLEAECGLRSKDKNTTSMALVYGEEIQKEVFAQGEHEISETKLRNFKNAAQILLNKQRYFTEEQLRIQYLKKDHHMKSKDSKRVTAVYLSRTVLDVECVKTRVNSDVRDYYKLPKSIKSNSFIYVQKNNQLKENDDNEI
jgi:hypothetical protein